MRVCRFLVLLVAIAVLAGCARQPSRQYAGPPPVRSDLDMMTYGAPAAYRQPPMYGPGYGPPPAYGPVPSPSHTVRYATQYVPVREMPEEGPYTLDTGDKLRVVVFGQEGLSASYSVDTSGKITMPLIGAVNARGMTPAGLQLSIAAKLKNGFVREPHVAVEVELYRPFFILGEVTLPGQYPYVPNMTVETAVAIAGGYTPRAFKQKIELTHQINGLTERRVVSPNYPVRPGDTVHIAERWF